jgi:hypothetical protein
VATALARDLVFHVHRGDVGADHVADRARDVERAAPAGIDVDQQRQAADFGDALRVGDDVVHRRNAEVRHAQRVRGHAAAGQVDGLEAAALGHAGGVGGDRADDLQRRFLLDGLAEQQAARLTGHGGAFR